MLISVMAIKRIDKPPPIFYLFLTKNTKSISSHCSHIRKDQNLSISQKRKSKILLSHKNQIKQLTPKGITLFQSKKLTKCKRLHPRDLIQLLKKLPVRAKKDIAAAIVVIRLNSIHNSNVLTLTKR